MTLPFHIRHIVGPVQLVLSKNESEPFTTAVLTVVSNRQQYTLHLHNPRPLEPLLQVFGECYELILIDRNAEENNQLEFGRYRLEVWDEDNPTGELVLDRYEVTESIL